MFDISWSELFLIALIAIFFVEPSDIPKIIRNIKIFLNNFSKFKTEFISLFNEIENEAKISDLAQDVKIDFEQFSKEFLEPIDSTKKDNKTKENKEV